MKKLRLLMGLILFACGTSALWAAGKDKDDLDEAPAPAPAVKSSPSQSKFSFSIGPSLVIPASSNTSAEYNVGGGGELFIGYSVSNNFMIGLDAGLQDASVNTAFYATTFQKTYGVPLPSNVAITGDFNYFPVMAVARFSIGKSPQVKPYVFWGMGAAINQASAAILYQGQSIKITGNETSFLLSPGVGVAFRAADDLEFFFQARVDIDFTSNSNSDIFTLTATGSTPLLLQGNLSDDSPTLFIPIQAGLRFM